MSKSNVEFTVFTKSNCVQCRATKNYISNTLGSRFEEKDIYDEDGNITQDAWDYVHIHQLRSAPIVVVNYEEDNQTQKAFWSGFRPDRLAEF